MPKTGKFATSSEIEEVIKAFTQIRHAKLRAAILKMMKGIVKSETGPG